MPSGGGIKLNSSWKQHLILIQISPLYLYIFCLFFFYFSFYFPLYLCIFFLSFSSQKHTYIILTPLKPHFYIVKLGFTGVYIIFLIAAQNKDCGYSLEPPLTSTHNLCFEQKYEKYQIFFIWKFFIFFVVKFSIYLNRYVFIMLFSFILLYSFFF